ncbi:zinc-ribbon domain-containing protein [Pseudodesulfovibrio indicus]|uniref:zinc-ribbon domain-containing protein n=1 Tax=Pseudodesulfovibrio indicus TaxID=1716143 RepID=UPI002931B55A|nr:zinc-ribbon domain-containing protein [Pseudodesulfovibrio indicus]
MGGNNHSVITCTKCGGKNSDDTRFCARCGNKLQSSRKAGPDAPPPEEPLEPFAHQGLSPDLLRTLKRMAEAWVYLLLLGAVAAGCAFYEVWWPLYPAVALLGLLIWLRRI